MRARNLWIIAGIAIVAAVLVWAATRTPDREGAGKGTGAATGTGAVTGPTREPTRDIPPPRRIGPRRPEREQGLRPRLASLGLPAGVEVADLACDETTCLLTLSADDPAKFEAAVAQLEQLTDVAENVVLHAPADGRMDVDIMLK